MAITTNPLQNAQNSFLEVIAILQKVLRYVGISKEPGLFSTSPVLANLRHLFDSFNYRDNSHENCAAALKLVKQALDEAQRPAYQQAFKTCFEILNTELKARISQQNELTAIYTKYSQKTAFMTGQSLIEFSKHTLNPACTAMREADAAVKHQQAYILYFQQLQTKLSTLLSQLNNFYFDIQVLHEEAVQPPIDLSIVSPALTTQSLSTLYSY